MLDGGEHQSQGGNFGTRTKPSENTGFDLTDVTSMTDARPTTQMLDELTGGAFSAATSGERTSRIRDWLATEPPVESMQDVFRELSVKDKGAPFLSISKTSGCPGPLWIRLTNVCQRPNS